MKKTILFFSLILSMVYNLYAQQLPSSVQVSDKLNLAFNKNIEFLGFLHFIAYEAANIEDHVLDIGGKKVAEKEWQAYGYKFYQNYKGFAQNSHAIQIMEMAADLGLVDFWPLLLQVADFPHAQLNEQIDQKYYLAFSSNRDPEQARANVTKLLTAFNALYMEINFDGYLKDHSVYYRAAMQQLINDLPSANFIPATEQFYRKSFAHYQLVPSLTVSKGMGFGPKVENKAGVTVYNIFGAVDFQQLVDTAILDMGFGNSLKLRELSIHEFGHSFVNPQFNLLNADRLKKSSVLFANLQEPMSAQGYNTWKECLGEHLVRAGEVMIALKMGNSASAEKLKDEYINQRKFIYLPMVLEELGRLDTARQFNYQEFLNRVMLNLDLQAEKVAHVVETGLWSNPRLAKLHTEDIQQFWQLMDKNPKVSGDILQREYLDKGSMGLKAFIRNRIQNGNYLAKEIKKQEKSYLAIKQFSLSINDKKEQFYRCFENLKILYPKAVFPDVYFVIGANNSAGTVFNKGLIVGAERFGAPEKGDGSALNFDLIDEVVAHELVHFQQRYPKDNTLLAQSIMEGAADLIAELICGGHSNGPAYSYGEANQKQLWKEFQEIMKGNDWNGWLYSQKNNARPKDLGYWMGYKICKTYYSKSIDKKRAVEEILNITDFSKFLQDSGYNGEF